MSFTELIETMVDADMARHEACLRNNPEARTPSQV
jgi:hypothetical protein